jgi:phage I-like protein
MAISKTLRRLLLVLDMKEELHRRELGLAQNELAGLERAMNAAGKREQAGRRLVADGVECSNLHDRLAGVEEMEAGRKCAAALEPYVAQATQRADALRVAFLEARVERRRTETLVETARARESAEADRRAQRTLDDLYLSKLSGARDEEDRRIEKILGEEEE